MQSSEQRLAGKITEVEQRLTSRLQHVEVLIQDVVDGRAEMHQDLTEQLDKVRLELDRHTSYLRSIKRQLRTFPPRSGVC